MRSDGGEGGRVGLEGPGGGEMNEAAAIVTEGEPDSTLRRGVPFLELRAGQCKFPLGAKDEPPTRFCG